MARKRQGRVVPAIPLSGSLQHILDENPVTPGRIIHQHMGNGTDQFAILDNGATAHE